MADSTLWPGRPRWLPGGLLLALLVLGSSLYRGYGLSWDEPSNHYNGAVNVTFLIEALCPPAWQQRLVPKDPLLHPAATWPGYDHGPAFELPAAVLGRVLYPDNPQGYFQLRHLLVFLVFAGGLVVFYRLARLRYPGSYWLPLLGAAALVLTPRFFAEAFYNGKDIPFMVLFMLAMLTLVRLVQRPTWQRTAVHALATALAADVRLTGLLLLPAFTAVALLLQGWAPPAPGGQALPIASGRRRVRLFALYGGLALAATVAGWPYLWADPVGRLGDILGRTGHFPWPGILLYMGQLLPATRLPWHYLPVWIAITTPLPYLGLLALGAATGLRPLARRGIAALRQSGGWLDALFVGWLTGPILLIILDKSVVYDGWRHLYFVYPALLLLALRGGRAVGRAWQARQPGLRYLAGAALLLIALDTGRTTWFMARAYPNQQVYFSFLPAATAERLFERDYWGPSYRHGLEWLLRHDPSPHITVSGPQPPIIYVNWLLLDPAQRQRLQLVPDAHAARYYLTAYRWHPQPYADTLGPEVLAYRPGDGIKALSVFRRDSLRRPLPAVPTGRAPGR
ncbi:MAG: ArnT family glycosyltransferase [Janthinobacterium lividum]